MLSGRRIRYFTVAALLSYGPMVLVYAGCITGLGFWRISGVELFVMVPILGLFAAILATCGLIFGKSRDAAITTLVISSGLVLLFVPTLLLAGQLRTLGFYLATKRAEPLVAAIGQYQLDRGAPPAALDDLVPGYLTALPGGLPPLRILTGERAARYCRGNTWVLSSAVSTGLLNWDEFFYAPLENYDSCGRFERIGSWAYYHE